MSLSLNTILEWLEYVELLDVVHFWVAVLRMAWCVLDSRTYLSASPFSTAMAHCIGDNVIQLR
jgi:hypothetical protein